MFCIYLHCGSDNYPLGGQYIIMDQYGLTNAGSLWVLNFQPHRFQGIQLDYFHSQTTMLRGIGQIIVGEGMTGRSYLGCFFLVAEQGTRVQLVSDMHRPNKKLSYNVCISCSILFYQISLVWTILHMKHVPVVFLFSDARESLSNMWIFYWKSCLVRKWANVVKAYIIYIPPPVIQWLWWYIDTVKIVEKSYLPIDFVIKNW